MSSFADSIVTITLLGPERRNQHMTNDKNADLDKILSDQEAIGKKILKHEMCFIDKCMHRSYTWFFFVNIDCNDLSFLCCWDLNLC